MAIQHRGDEVGIVEDQEERWPIGQNTTPIAIIRWYNEMLEVTDPFETKEGATEAKLILEPPLKMAKMLSPVDNAPDIICCGLNYKQHAKEVGLDIPKLPTLFSKSRNTLQNPYDPIELPSCAENEVDYEGELAVVIGRRGRNIPKEEAMDYVFGYTVANDITARRWQGKKGGGQWFRGKSFDTFLPLGPSITAAWSLDPSDLRIVTEVNGQIVQESSTKDMIFDVPTLINFCSMDTTLMPGTIILTGTPAGVGLLERIHVLTFLSYRFLLCEQELSIFAHAQSSFPGYVRDPPLYLKAGDRVSVQIEGIGKLINPVVGPVTDAAT
eukprot:jgi/Bigna1/127315/aug1.4_g2023